MNNRHWEYASGPIAAVYEAHAKTPRHHSEDGAVNPLWKPGGHLRVVLEDMELSTEVLTSALDNAEKPPFGLPCPECIACAQALLELDEPGRFYAIQHYHYPNSTLTFNDWKAISESEQLPPAPVWAREN